MTATDRRAVLHLAAGALLLPLAVAVPAVARAAGRFAPPAGPMRYARRLERELRGGARMVVSRSFAVRFRPEDPGYRVEGEQIDVNVEAPEILAEFARLERARREVGLFPLHLDPDGGIASGPGMAQSAELDAAVRAALALIAERPRAPAEQAELVRFVNAFHQSAGRLVTELPRDLFAPGDAPRNERREIVLPGGDAGAVTVTFTAARDPATGLMREALREVVTMLAGDSRRTRESWSLVPLE